MSNEEIRNSERAALNQPAKIWDPESRAYVDVLLMDISITGAQLRVQPEKLSHKISDEIKLYWAPVPGLAPLLFEAKLIRQDEDVIGIQFGELSKKLGFILSSFVKVHREHFGSELSNNSSSK